MRAVPIQKAVTAALVRIEGDKRFCPSCQTLQPAEAVKKLRNKRGVHMKCTFCIARGHTTRAAS